MYVHIYLLIQYTTFERLNTIYIAYKRYDGSKSTYYWYHIGMVEELFLDIF